MENFKESFKLHHEVKERTNISREASVISSSKTADSKALLKRSINDEPKSSKKQSPVKGETKLETEKKTFISKSATKQKQNLVKARTKLEDKEKLLSRIDRKEICSNWKTFREIIKEEPTEKRSIRKTYGKELQTTHSCKNNDSKQRNREKKKLGRHHPNKKPEGLNVKVNGVINSGDNFNRTLKKLNRQLQKVSVADSSNDTNSPKAESSRDPNSPKLTKEIGLDCEMVGSDCKSDMVARVSMVNRFGECIYDKYVAPTEEVVDYRTWVSGIRPENLKNGENFEKVQKEVADLLHGRILVGHAVRNDLKVLFLGHPRRFTRDTQRFQVFRDMVKSKRPSLKKLAADVLGINIQTGEHNSVEDAKVAMQLYMMYRKKWEKMLKTSKRTSEKKTAA